jgi:hypothetical protein
LELPASRQSGFPLSVSIVFSKSIFSKPLQELPLVVLQAQQKNRIFTKTIFTANGSIISVINPNFDS